MLKAIWDKAVHKYQAIRQEGDVCQLAMIDEKIAEAKQGYLSYIAISPMGVGSVMGRVKLSPEEAADFIAEKTREREDLVRAMEERRVRYNLQPK